MASTRPTVSVVIPNYNYARTLGRCLASVYAQTYRPAEVIVVDDGSTDGSVEIARDFPCTVIRRPANGGVSAARNAGVAASTGEILFFLDSDEALAPDAIANAVALLGKGYACVHGVIAPEPLIDDGPVEWCRTLHAYWWRARGAGEVRTAFFAQAAIPRRVFDEVGPFDEGLRDSEDLEYSDRLAPDRRILLSEAIVAHHDEVDRLRPLLREQFRRSQLLVPTLLAARRRGRAGLTANTPLGIGSVALALAALPAGLLWPRWLALPVLSVLLFLVADPGLVRFVARRKGIGFTAFFLGVHLLTHVALVAGAAVGGLRYATRRWSGILTAIVVVAALVAAGVALSGDGLAAALGTLTRPAALPLLVLSLTANAAGLLLGMHAWRVLLAGEGRRIRGLAAARIYFLGQLSKYLPGRVWGVVTHVELGRGHGVGGAQMTSAYLLSIGVTILTGATVGLLAAPSAAGEESLWLGIPVVLLLACLGWPRLVTRPIAAVARRTRRQFVAPPDRVVRHAVALATASWLVSGIHLWALAVALGAAPAASAAPAIGAFGLATVAGSLALVVPDGWGVREVTIVAALAAVMPWAAATAAAVGSRLVCVLAEVVSSLVVLAWARVKTGAPDVRPVHP